MCPSSGKLLDSVKLTQLVCDVCCRDEAEAALQSQAGIDVCCVSEEGCADIPSAAFTVGAARGAVHHAWL